MGNSVLGARFHKADLHVHTPGSKSDYVGNEDPTAFAAAARAATLDVIAVTDHNTADWVSALRAAGKKIGLIVLPGVEITTPEGHILAIFEKDYEPTKINDLLVEIGIPRDAHGRESAISKEHAETVMQRIANLGGLAIAAHANDTNGLLKMKGQYKLKTVPMKELAALELSKQEEIAKFCTGKVSQDYAPKACVQASDSHCIADLGRRPTFFKMQEPSLHGIRLALFDFELKVRFPWDIKEPVHPRIVSLSVNQGFFAGQRFDFHHNLNCLIGGKGTGKSTVIELLRYCFEDVAEFESIREDHVGKIDKLVAQGATVSVEYLDADSVLKIVKREVQPWGTSREVRDEHGNLSAIEAPPAFFSQGELVQIASSTIAQMDLFDRHLDLGDEDRTEHTILNDLDTNAGQIVAVAEKIGTLQEEIDNSENGKQITEARFKTLEDQLKDPVLKSFPAWEAEQQLIADSRDQLVSLRDEFTTAIEGIDYARLSRSVPDDSPNRDAFAVLETFEAAARAAAKKAVDEFSALIAGMEKQVDGIDQTLHPAFETTKAKNESVLSSMGQADARKANAQFRSVGKRLEQLRQFEADLSQLKKGHADLAKTRATLLKNLAIARKNRWQKRFGKMSSYQGKLAGLVRLNIIAGGDRTEFAKKLREISKKGYIEELDLRKVSEKLHPAELSEYVSADNAERIAQAAGVTKKVAERLVKAIGEKGFRALCELETVALPDKPEVSYIFPQGKEKLLKELSTGQKGTVIIALAMIEGAGPLVIDQPEEPLDTESIYGQVVRTLRSKKEERQFIFTTHNPNVAVGADAELSHVLEAGADSGAISSSGAIDHEATNKLLLLHLEGGEEALRLRVGKYRLQA